MRKMQEIQPEAKAISSVRRFEGAIEEASIYDPGACAI
jgi:hypothetical protein